MPDLLKMQIAREIYIAPENLDADEHLLSIIGSWGDTPNDEEILALLKHYNATDKEFEDPASLR